MTTLYYDCGEGLPGKGKMPADWMVVGQSPSTKRPAHRKLEPFGSRSYAILEALTSDLEGNLYVTNAIKEPMKPGAKVKKADIDYWEDVLYDEITLVQPRRILAIGDVAGGMLCPGYDGLRSSHGSFFWNERGNCWVVPTYHFAAMYRNPDWGAYMKRDLERFFTLDDPELFPYWFLEGTREDILDIERQILAQRPREVVIDLETTGLEVDAEITMLGIGWEGLDKALILRSPDPQWLEDFGRMLLLQDIPLVGHNLSFDLYHLTKATNWGFPRLRFRDSMIGAHVAGEPSLGLKHLTSFHTDLPGSRAGGGFEDPAYLAEDVRSTIAVYDVFREYSEDTFIGQLLNDLTPVAVAMRLRGTYVDQDVLRNVQEQVDPLIADIENQLREYGDINWNSNQQVSEVLLEQGIELTEKTDAGNWSLAEDVLLALLEEYDEEDWQHELVQGILDYRAALKLERSFIIPYFEHLEWDGYLHGRLKLTGTRTGRFSMSDPNLQQVPRKGPIKKAFRARWEGGHLGLVDLSQAELRMACFFAGDAAMANALVSADVHRFMASRALGKEEDKITATERKAIKAITFGLLYGGSPGGLAKRAGLREKQVRQVLKVYESQFPRLMAYLKHIEDVVTPTGVVTLPFGRKRDLTARLKLYGNRDVYRKVVNTPIQGTASECMAVILRETDFQLRSRRMNSRPLFLVHDSMMLEIYPGEEDEVVEVVQGAFQKLAETPLQQFELFGTVPLVGDFVIGETWAAVESTNEAYNPRSTHPCSSHPVIEE